MRRAVWISILAAAVASLYGLKIVAQQPPQPEMPLPPSSPYGGLPLRNPAILAGLWEAANGHGGIVGIQILLNTRGENVETIEFGLFERTGRELGDLPFNYFAPQGRGADTCHWDGHHLTIDFVPPLSSRKLTPEQQARFVVTPVHVDLVWDEAVGTWTGLFQYKSSPGNVVLRRPTPAAPGTRNPFVGNWINKRGPTDSCLHIAEESDGQLNGWVDSIPAPERIIFPRGMPPTPMMGHYGDMTKVGPAKDGQITVEFGAYSGMCCSRSFEAKLSTDGTVLEGGYLGGPNQAALQAKWNRAVGELCGTENAITP